MKFTVGFYKTLKKNVDSNKRVSKLKIKIRQ
jgi:hypothetical protein